MVQAGGGRTPAPREADAEGTGILGGYAGEVGSLMMTRRGGRGVADGASGGFRTTSSSVRSNKKTRFLPLGYHA